MARAAPAGQAGRRSTRRPATPTSRCSRRCSSGPGGSTFTGYDAGRPGEATVIGLLVGGVLGRRRGRGHRGRGGARPHPVLRRGRRPARRHRGDPGQRVRRWRGRRGRGRDVQTPVPGLIVHRGTVVGRRDHGRRARPRRRSTSSAAGRSPARTPRPTWCTARSAARSASRRRRRARRTRPAGSGSTSPRPARCRRRCCATPRTRSTRS